MKPDEDGGASTGDYVRGSVCVQEREMGEGVLDGSSWAQSQECHRCKPNKSMVSPQECLLATTTTACHSAQSHKGRKKKESDVSRTRNHVQ